MDELLNCFVSCELENLKVLLEEIGINSKIPETEGFTPLHVIAGVSTLRNLDDIMTFLLEEGADPNARSDENLTPVHIASMWNRVPQLEKLLQYGGDPWLTDDENKNCFTMADDNNCYEAYHILCKYLHEDKLNSKCKEKETKKSLSFNLAPETRCFEDGDNLNNSLNLTFMTAKDSKEPNFASPSFFSTPRLANETFRSENLNNSANLTFMSAKENFPLIFSSHEESDEYSTDASEFLKRLNLGTGTKDEKTEENHSPDADKDVDTVDNSVGKVKISNFNEKENNSEKKPCQNNLNKAYIFSSSSENSDTATSDLNDSGDSSCGTIIDSNDTSGFVLIEVKNDDKTLHLSHSSVCNVSNDWKSYHNITSNCSVLSNCLSHSKSSLIVPEDVQKYSNSKIFQELKNMGDNPGPVLEQTRHVYLHRLTRLLSGCVTSCVLPKPKFCPEIYLFLENKLDMDRARYLEQNIEEEFDAETSKNWREGNQRCCFNYFLLDPRVTRNLPNRASDLTKEQVFLTFLDALFYVGKGTKGRPYSHLFEAAKSMYDDRPKSTKVNHILDIWDAGLGVISLHCFHNSIPVEAYTREACILEAVGLDNLTNVRKGDYYGLCAKLTASRKRLIGISLLNRALQIFLLEGERFIKPKDIMPK